MDLIVLHRNRILNQIINHKYIQLIGSPILLATAQSIQSYSLPPLLGVFTIDLNITYVSDMFYKGIFEENRRHNYEKQFYHLKGANYQLDLADGRWFRFMKEADGSFKDMGSLGVEITQIDEQTFELYYPKSATTEYYHKKYLHTIEDSNGNRIELTYQKTKNPKVELLKSMANSSNASWSFSYNEQELVKSISDHVGRVWSFRYDKENYLTSTIFNKELEESFLSPIAPETAKELSKCLVQPSKRTFSFPKAGASQPVKIESIML